MRSWCYDDIFYEEFGLGFFFLSMDYLRTIGVSREKPGKISQTTNIGTTPQQSMKSKKTKRGMMTFFFLNSRFNDTTIPLLQQMELSRQKMKQIYIRFMTTVKRPFV